MQTSGSVLPIVVGYDGSPSADQALRWAFVEGSQRGIPVHVVHVMDGPSTPLGEFLWMSPQQRAQARADVDKAIVAAGDGAAEVSILQGQVAGTLCELSRGAALMVLGARGRGGFGGLLLGSVSLVVTVHALCPVVVVRGEEQVRTASLPIVVGVDDSAEAAHAIDFALAHAQAHGCAVHAIRAWQAPNDVRDVDELETAEHHAARETLARHTAAFPDVDVALRLIYGSPARVLVAASEHARMVVVGSRGRGAIAGWLLGSVSQQLLHHAHCPVAIVR